VRQADGEQPIFHLFDLLGLDGYERKRDRVRDVPRPQLPNHESSCDLIISLERSRTSAASPVESPTAL
jgi:hypothetical protein